MKLSKAFELDDFNDYDDDDEDDEEDDDDDYEDDSSEDHPEKGEPNDDISKLEGYPKTNKREGFLQVLIFRNISGLLKINPSFQVLMNGVPFNKKHLNAEDFEEQLLTTIMAETQVPFSLHILHILHILHTLHTLHTLHPAPYTPYT